MASAFSHAIAAAALTPALKPGKRIWTALILGALCAVVPDLDVVGFPLGIRYESVWGHRGISHSIFFAALLAALIVAAVYRRESKASQAGFFFYLFACGISHGLLDAMTTGGQGVAFFAPFKDDRYFFGFRPILVSPIGFRRFFTGRGLEIIASEFKWIWIPSACVGGFLYWLRRERVE